jgi:hypothetical protein
MNDWIVLFPLLPDGRIFCQKNIKTVFDNFISFKNILRMHKATFVFVVFDTTVARWLHFWQNNFDSNNFKKPFLLTLFCLQKV